MSKPGRLLVWGWAVLVSIILGLVVVGLLIIVVFEPAPDQATPTNTIQRTPPPLPTVESAPVQTNAEWQPIIRQVEGVSMVLVPSGSFIMGQATGSELTRQQNRVTFDAPFWIDRYEMSNADYLRFVRAYLDPQAECASAWCEDDRPVGRVSWQDAAAVCAWRGGALPTAAEWEYAARGVDGLLYPWGDDFLPEVVIFRDNFKTQGAGQEQPQPAPIGGRESGASWVGAEDLLGNMQEWIADTSTPNPSPRARFVRGGSAMNNTLSVFNEIGYSTLVRNTDYDGFRCVRAISPISTTLGEG